MATTTGSVGMLLYDRALSKALLLALPSTGSTLYYWSTSTSRLYTIQDLAVV